MVAMSVNVVSLVHCHHRMFSTTYQATIISSLHNVNAISVNLSPQMNLTQRLVNCNSQPVSLEWAVVATDLESAKTVKGYTQVIRADNEGGREHDLTGIRGGEAIAYYRCSV